MNTFLIIIAVVGLYFLQDFIRYIIRKRKEAFDPYHPSNRKVCKRCGDETSSSFEILCPSCIDDNMNKMRS